MRDHFVERMRDRNFLQLSLAASVVINFVFILLLAAAMQDYAEIQRQMNLDTDEKPFLNFVDEKLGVNFQYPTGWAINTNVNTDSSYEDPKVSVGNIPDLAQLDVIVTDENTKLQFVHFFGPLEENSSRFPTERKNYEIIQGEKGNLLRYQSTDLDKWYYVDVVECEEQSVRINEEAGLDLCTGDYFSGFVPGPSRVVLSGRINRDILEMMDRVVLSAML